jgi:alpha-ribazole phosphatase
MDRDTILWLVRHAEPEEAARGVCYGSLNVGLSPKGMKQAESIAAALAGRPFDAIYTSPSRRCMDTARRIAAGRTCAMEVIDALRELNFGEFEGLTYDEIGARYPDLYRQGMERPTETQFPGGESFAQMSDRVMTVTRQVLARHRGGAILFVTHGGGIRIILAEALGLSAPHIFRIGQRYGAVNRIRYSEGTAVVDLMNAVSER